MPDVSTTVKTPDDWEKMWNVQEKADPDYGLNLPDSFTLSNSAGTLTFTATGNHCHGKSFDGSTAQGQMTVDGQSYTLRLTRKGSLTLRIDAEPPPHRPGVGGSAGGSYTASDGSAQGGGRDGEDGKGRRDSHPS
jgi:hypothetical protein